MEHLFRYGLVVRITRFHRVGRGSIPRIGNIDKFPERSKGVDSRSTAICFMGSNPILVIIFFFHIHKNFEMEFISKKF